MADSDKHSRGEEKLAALLEIPDGDVRAYINGRYDLYAQLERAGYTWSKSAKAWLTDTDLHPELGKDFEVRVMFRNDYPEEIVQRVEEALVKHGFKVVRSNAVLMDTGSYIRSYIHGFWEK